MNEKLRMGLIGMLGSILAHDLEGEFDFDAAKPIAREYQKALEKLPAPEATCGDCRESSYSAIDDGLEIICTDGGTTYASSIHADGDSRETRFCRMSNVLVEHGCPACPDYKPIEPQTCVNCGFWAGKGDYAKTRGCCKYPTARKDDNACPDFQIPGAPE